VLLLREVLGYSATETASMIGASVVSVNNALLRARRRLTNRLPADGPDTTVAQARDGLVGRYVRAWHAADVDSLVALLCEDADMSMPPTPSWYHGRDHIGIYLAQLFAGPLGQRLRLVPTAANRQPALAVYAPTDDGTAAYRPFAIKLLTVHNGLISAVTGFVHQGLFRWFSLPSYLPVPGGV
jgi:RNA polymerase sigma-70 factor, ECF subfamily